MSDRNTRQAIQIKYIAPTNTKDSRLQAFASAGRITKVLCNNKDIEEQAYNIAIELMKKFEWDSHSKISGFGVLANGDFVMTMEKKYG